MSETAQALGWFAYHLIGWMISPINKVHFKILLVLGPIPMSETAQTLGWFALSSHRLDDQPY